VTQVTFAYRALPVHTAFHVSRARERALAGAMGSGKSYALCAEAIAWCLEQPGIRGVLARKSIPALRDTTEAVFFDLLPPELYKAGEARRSGGHVAEFIFPNGSTVLFKSMDDYLKHKSLNIGFFAADEANELTVEEWEFMTLGRLRQRDPTAEAISRGYTDEITRRGAWLAFNPEGHDWIYERFINQAGDDYKPGNEWFRSTSFDNPYLPVDYLDSLLAMPEPWVKRYVLCQFDDFAGQIYETWGWDTHVIPPVKDIDRGSVFWHGMDPGTRNPTAGLWVWLDQANRRLVGIAEYEQAGIAATAHAAAWRAIEAQHKMNVRWRVADPSIETRDRGSNMKLSDQYRRLGFNFAHGPKQHKDRIPMLGQLIHTNRFVLTSDCPLAYEAIKGYRWEDITPVQRSKGVDPREAPVKKNDHLVDCAQYLSSRWVKPMSPESLERPETFSDEVWSMMRKKVRTQGMRHGVTNDFGLV
jgi:PBSX family phage terminase large subunit